MKNPEQTNQKNISVEADITVMYNQPIVVWYYLTRGNGEREKLLDHYVLMDKLREIEDSPSIAIKGIFDSKIDYSSHRQAIQEKLRRLEQKVRDAAPSANITILN